MKNRTLVHMNFFHQHDMTNQFPEGMTFFMNHPVEVDHWLFLDTEPEWRTSILHITESYIRKLRHRIPVARVAAARPLILLEKVP